MVIIDHLTKFFWPEFQTYDQPYGATDFKN